MVAGMVNARQEVRLDEGAENERLHPQYVSGNVFPSFGLEPAPDACSGRAAMSDPGAFGRSPQSRLPDAPFARDRAVIVRTFVMEKTASTSSVLPSRVGLSPRHLRSMEDSTP
jgi:hypothetical protein